MVRNLPAACAVAGLAIGAGADDRPTKKKPADAKSYDESTKEFKVGEKRTVNVTRYVAQTITERIVVNNMLEVVTKTVMVPVTTTIMMVVPERKWTLGATGWHDGEGFNVEKVTAGGPLAKVRQLDGNKETFRKVEPNDVITKLDNLPVTSELHLYLAIQNARTPERVPIEFISARDGKTYIGTIEAAKVKK